MSHSASLGPVLRTWEIVASSPNREYFSPHLPKMCAARQIREDDSLAKKVWTDIEPAVRAIVGDTIVFLVILASLALVFVGLGWLAGLGYDATRIERFEAMHYWGSFSVLAVFLLSFVIRMALLALRIRK